MTAEHAFPCIAFHADGPKVGAFLALSCLHLGGLNGMRPLRSALIFQNRDDLNFEDDGGRGFPRVGCCVHYVRFDASTI